MERKLQLTAVPQSRKDYLGCGVVCNRFTCNLSLLFFHRQAVALVYEHGEGGPTRAVCVDKGLDFTIGEMSSGDLGPLTNNRLFRGGEVWRFYTACTALGLLQDRATLIIELEHTHPVRVLSIPPS